MYVKLYEEIYMEIPQGYKEVFPAEDTNSIDSLLLKQALYGVVQATRQWWKTVSTTLETIDFQISPADPCLAYKQNQEGICLLIIYIDDILIVGVKTMIEYTVTELRKRFSVKEV